MPKQVQKAAYKIVPEGIVYKDEQGENVITTIKVSESKTSMMVIFRNSKGTESHPQLFEVESVDADVVREKLEAAAIEFDARVEQEVTSTELPVDSFVSVTIPEKEAKPI